MGTPLLFITVALVTGAAPSLSNDALSKLGLGRAVGLRSGLGKYTHATDVNVMISGHSNPPIRRGGQDFTHSKDMASTFATRSPATSAPKETRVEKEADSLVPKASKHEGGTSVANAYKTPHAMFKHDFDHSKDMASTFATRSPATASPAKDRDEKEADGLVPKESAHGGTSVADAYQSPPSMFQHDFDHHNDLAATWSTSSPAHVSTPNNHPRNPQIKPRHDAASSVANAYKSPPAMFKHDFFHNKDLARTWETAVPAAANTHATSSQSPSFYLPKDAAHDFDHVITLGLSYGKIHQAADGSVFGWLVHRSPNGIYYENVNTHQTTWTRPAIFNTMHVNDDAIVAQGDKPAVTKLQPAADSTDPRPQAADSTDNDKQHAELRLARTLQDSLRATSPDARKLRAALEAVQHRKVMRGLSHKEHALLDTAEALQKIKGLHGEQRHLQQTITAYVHQLQKAHTMPNPRIVAPIHRKARKAMSTAAISKALVKEIHNLDALKNSGSDEEHRRALMTLAQKIALGKMPGLSKELRHSVLRLVNEIKWRIKTKAIARIQTLLHSP